MFAVDFYKIIRKMETYLFSFIKYWFLKSRPFGIHENKLPKIRCEDKRGVFNISNILIITKTQVFFMFRINAWTLNYIST